MYLINETLQLLKGLFINNKQNNYNAIMKHGLINFVANGFLEFFSSSSVA